MNFYIFFLTTFCSCKLHLHITFLLSILVHFILIMATPLPFHTLDEQPRLHFAEFERQVFDDAGSTSTDIFNTGFCSSSSQILFGPLFPTILSLSRA